MTRQCSQYLPNLLLFSFLLLLISSSKCSSTSVIPKHGLGESDEVSLGNKFEGVEPTDELTGLEKCGKEDEECLKRRLISEAHLDYIYTQQHNP